MAHSPHPLEPQRTGAGRVEIYESNGRYWFRLVRSEGEPLLLSSDYASRDAALWDVERLRRPSALFRSCMTATGLYYFRTTTSDGEFLATSTMYTSPADRDEAQALAARLMRGGPQVLRVVLV